MVNARERTLAVPDSRGVRSLVWSGDALVDHVAGGNVYRLDGDVEPSRSYHPFRFDAAIVSPSGRLAILYERLGTKAIVVRTAGHRVLRELSRSYYCANSYEYPIAFAALQDGRDAIVHCPRAYNRIDVEDAETGACLTDGAPREHADVFHSRLVPSPDGAFVVSGGWCWHPYGVACVLPLADALHDPQLLDREPLELRGYAYVTGAAWLDAGRVAIASCGEDDTDAANERLWTWDARAGTVEGERTLASTAGTVHVLGGRWLLALHGHPRLLDPATGAVLHEWPHLRTGAQRGAVVRPDELPPPCAVHPTAPWFAVTGEGAITVVQLD